MRNAILERYEKKITMTLNKKILMKKDEACESVVWNWSGIDMVDIRVGKIWWWCNLFAPWSSIVEKFFDDKCHEML